MASGSCRNTARKSSASSNGSTEARSIREMASAWPSAKKLSNVTVAGFGSSPNLPEVPNSSLPFRERSMTRDPNQLSLLLVEDSPADVFLVREVMREEGFDCVLNVADRKSTRL